jgi:hypothetical protein
MELSSLNEIIDSITKDNMFVLDSLSLLHVKS